MIRSIAGISTTALALGLCAQAAAQVVGEGASAQAGAGATLDEIVVTAQKRSESLQTVPLAVTAVTSGDLARSHVKDLEGVAAMVPNLNLGRQLGVARVALRGIGLESLSPGAEGSIAFHVDGVFVSRSVAALSSFYDVEQVEVLRGPQGTLYGRNATGGSINIVTRSPTAGPSGYLDLTAGNYGRYAGEGAVSGTLVEGVLQARLAARVEHYDGYGRNVATGRSIDDLDTRSVRGKLRFTPTPRLSFDLAGDYHHERDRAGGYHFLGAGGLSASGVAVTPVGVLLGPLPPSDRRNIDNDRDPYNRVEFWGVTARTAYEVSPEVQLRALSAYRRTDYATRTDLDSTRAPLTFVSQSERAEQYSQELQLSGRTDRLEWLVGAFYFHETNKGRLTIPFNNLLVGFPAPGVLVQGYFSGGSVETDAVAAFGQATYELAEGLRLTLGARYSSEKKTNHDQFQFDVFTPYDPRTPVAPLTLDQSKRFESFTPRLALDYRPSPDVLLYGSWSKGFKAGTYNLGSLRSAVDPEKVTAWEAGFKSTVLDRRVRLNLAAFHYDYKDLQVGKVRDQLLVLENAATATIYGLEAEVRAKVTPRFEVNASAAWLHARFDEYVSADPARPSGDGRTIDPESGAPAFDLSGHSLSQSPDFTLFVGAEYGLPTEAGTFTLRAEVAWRDRVYFSPFNVKAVSQDPNTKVNAFLTWTSEDETWRASVFAKNLTDKTTVSNSYVSSVLVGFPINGYLEEPRTFGMTLGYRF